MSQLKSRYEKEVVPQLIETFKYANKMQDPTTNGSYGSPNILKVPAPRCVTSALWMKLSKRWAIRYAAIELLPITTSQNHANIQHDLTALAE